MVIKMKTLIAGAALLVATSVNAETAQLPIECASVEQYSEIVERAGEIPKFLGESRAQNGSDLYTVVHGNETTGTWTLALYNRTAGVICIVSFGKGYSIYADGDKL